MLKIDKRIDLKYGGKKTKPKRKGRKHKVVDFRLQKLSKVLSSKLKTLEGETQATSIQGVRKTTWASILNSSKNNHPYP